MLLKQLSLFRQLTALEEDNANLLKNLNAKEEALRNAQVGQKFLIEIISKDRTTLIIKITRLNEFISSGFVFLNLVSSQC